MSDIIIVAWCILQYLGRRGHYYPQCSYHYTRDGYEIAIFYDSSFSASEILISKIYE